MLPAHYRKEGTSYFCRFTFGQFFTLLVLEIFTLFFVFYLGARYGKELLGIQTEAVSKPGLPKVATTDEAYVTTTQDPEIKALAKDILEKTPTPDLKQRVEEMLQTTDQGPGTRDQGPKTIKQKKESITLTKPQEISPVIQTVPPGAKYSLQVGSYPDLEEAHTSVNRWKAKGYPVFLLSADIPGKGRWYRVRLGSFQNKEEALVFLEDFKKKEGVDAFVAPNF